MFTQDMTCNATDTQRNRNMGKQHQHLHAIAHVQMPDCFEPGASPRDNTVLNLIMSNDAGSHKQFPLKNTDPRNQWYRDHMHEYRQISNISRTLVGYKIVDHSDVVGASPVGAAPTTSSFST